MAVGEPVTAVRPPFEFATATRIVFGEGSLQQAGALVAEMGTRALVVTGANAERARSLRASLAEHSVESDVFPVAGEPSVELVRSGVEQARLAERDVVIAIGGGSAIDAGKAIAALLANPGPPLDYLEVVGQGKPLSQPSAPFVAIPTTAGTGAEVTRNAVLTVEAQHVKVSMRSPLMLPRLALIDPELTHSMPPDVTASTGLDALSQLLEPFLSSKANPLTDALCREGISRAARSLERAYRDGSDDEARHQMALASLLGGLALANAKLGAVHGFAGPVGGLLAAPHGVICARFLPHVFRCNLEALRQRAPGSPVVARFDEVARLLTGHPAASAEDGAQWIEQLCTKLDVPPLRSFGLRADHFDDLVERAQRASSMAGNPIKLTPVELRGLVAAACG